MSVCLSVAYTGPKSRTERPRKTKIGAEVGHVTRDPDTTFKVKMSKVNLQGAGVYCGGLPHSLLHLSTMLCFCLKNLSTNFYEIIFFCEVGCCVSGSSG